MKVKCTIFLFFIALAVQAQDNYELEEQIGSYDYESKYYKVRSYISTTQARETGSRLDAYIEYFTTYFHFDLNSLEHKLRVRIFDTQENYDQYLKAIINETRQDFVYLHNSIRNKSELLGYIEGHSEPDPSFTHQAFVQFIRSFIDHPPLWLREGFAVYFERMHYREGMIASGNSLAWLRMLKSILVADRKSEALDLDRILFSNLETAKQNIDAFYPQSWGVIYYLLNVDNLQYNRIIWDAIAALDPNANLTTNSSLVYEKSFRWINSDIFMADLIEYFDQLKTYPELIEDGIAAYALEDFNTAQENLYLAIERRDDSFIPYYYLGLINYDEGNYEAAEYNYQQALNREQEDALIFYALGLNAFAADDYNKASGYFETTLRLDMQNFSDKVDRIRERMRN